MWPPAFYTGIKMKSEISFLLDLILDEELSPAVQKLCRRRIRDLESNVVSRPIVATQTPIRVNTGAVQAPSTQRLLDEMASQTGAPVPIEPVTHIAQTAQAAAAMAARQSAINIAISGKPEAGRTSPRKF